MAEQIMTEQILVPEIDEDNAPFWEGARKGELRMQRCAGCGRFSFPPRPMCPACHSIVFQWPVLSGRGTIWSYVVPHPPLLPYYMKFAPYNVICVALDEDPTLRLIGNLVEKPGGPLNAIDPAGIRIGEPVRVAFEKLTEEISLPRWVRAA
jgi:hypothetical protein